MKNTLKGIIIGIIAGIFITAIGMVVAMPRMMLHENKSPLGYEETISHLENAITNGGWIISRKMDMRKSLAKHGKKAPPVTLLKICQADYASTILNDEESMYVSVMMPCTIAVYQKKDGGTYVSTMNIKMMGQMFGGIIADVMAGKVAKDEAEFTAFLHRH